MAGLGAAGGPQTKRARAHQSASPPLALRRLLEPDVLELERLALDADGGRGDPVGDLAGLRDGVHEALDVLAVCAGGEPLGLARLELLGRNHSAVEVKVVARVLADVAVEARRGEAQLVIDALLGD